jgi:hypothetical protein
MTEQPDQIERIRPQVEILPFDHSDPPPVAGAPPMWVTVNTQGGTRRVYVAKPGPLATMLIFIGVGTLLAVSIVLAVGIAAIFLTISAVTAVGIFVAGSLRWARRRPR